MSTCPWHDQAWQMLRQRAVAGSLPHALLLQGPAGLGKRDFGERLVRARLCEQPDATTGDACGHCRACTLLDAGTHPDHAQISLEPNREGKLRKEIIVEQIRALSQRLSMSSQFGGWQMVRIEPADAMNPAAANALLKTLEEPSAQSMLILIADAAWRLPATVRSRCQRIVFRAPERAQAIAWLGQHDLEESAAGAALDAAGGNPGAALALARDQALPRRAAVLRDVDALRSGRVDAWSVARDWLSDAPEQRLLFAARELHRRATEVASGADAATLEHLGDAFMRINQAREWLRGPLRPELVLLDALVPLTAKERAP